MGVAPGGGKGPHTLKILAVLKVLNVQKVLNLNNVLKVQDLKSGVDAKYPCLKSLLKHKK